MIIAVLILHSQWKILHTLSRRMPIKGANPDCDAGEPVPLHCTCSGFQGRSMIPPVWI